MAQPGTLLQSQAALDAFQGNAPPRQGAWSDDDYLRLTDRSNRLVEFTDGYVQELPMPTSSHQATLGFLYRVFHAWLEPSGGLAAFAPLRLRVRPGKFREPDLLVLRNRSDFRFQDRFWLGADLVVEVVSPANADRDLVTKRSDYAEASIPEYWIVDPRNETITVLELSDEASTAQRQNQARIERAYVERGVYARGHAAESVLLVGLAVDVAAVFDSARNNQLGPSMAS